MTMWTPDLSETGGPLSRAIVNALAADIEAGRIEPGTRLPTHRELADRLGVAIGTVTRAYALAKRRGLVSGEVGRGTFVGSGTGASREETSGGAEAPIDLSKNQIARETQDRLLAETLAALSARSDLAPLLEYYQPAEGVSRHRAAGAAWVGRIGLDADPAQTLVCSGAQHAMFVALSVLTRPGETVLTEQLTYPGIKALASLLHLNLHGLAMDEEGLRPDAFAAACRSVKAKVLYCIPTLQNPTASVMPEARRRELAAIAAANDVTIIEDDIYGALLPSAPRPIAVHAPAHCYYITGTSKSIAPGLRIGYLVVPLEAVERAANVIRTNLWETAPLMAEIMTTWIEDGTADRIIEWKRTETAARQRLALDVLGNLYGETRPITGSHLWLQLPEPWRSGDFIAQARSRGVIVTGSEAFVAGRATAPHAVRVCLGSPASRPQLAKGLKILAETLRNSPQPALTLT